MTLPEREVTFSAAYDKRDPDPTKNYGIHGVHINFTLRKRGEGITFSISTGWQLPHVQAETDARPLSLSSSPYLFHKPTAFGVDYHFLEPQYEGQTKRDECHVTGRHCYCDGSGLLGDDFLQTLIAGGDEALWKRMEEQLDKWKAPQ